MQKFFLTAPYWLVVAAFGVPFGFFAVLVFVIGGGHSWLVVAGYAVFGAVLVGGAMAASAWRQRRMVRSAVGDLAKDKAVAAMRAVAKGHVPADDEVRAAALAIATRQLTELYRPVLRYTLLLVVGIGAAASVFNLVAGEWLSLSPILLVLLGAWLLLIWPRQLKRRIELLSGGQDTAG